LGFTAIHWRIFGDARKTAVVRSTPTPAGGAGGVPPVVAVPAARVPAVVPVTPAAGLLAAVEALLCGAGRVTCPVVRVR
jgi:hypothetical protein